MLRGAAKEAAYCQLGDDSIYMLLMSWCLFTVIIISVAITNKGNPRPGLAPCISQRTVRPSFDVSQPFWSPFRCSWWFGLTKNKATTRQPCILCGWPVRLEQTATAYSFSTYIINVQKHAQDTSVLSFRLHWLTVTRVRVPNIVRRPCSDTTHVIALYQLSLHYLLLFVKWRSSTFKHSSVCSNETCLRLSERRVQQDCRWRRFCLSRLNSV